MAAIREVVGSITQRDFNKAIVITTSDFTMAARDEAACLGVELYERSGLLWLLRQFLHREFTVIDHSQRKPPFDTRPKSTSPAVGPPHA